MAAGSGTVLDDLRAAGEELVVRAQKLRDVLTASAGLAQDAMEDIKDRLSELAADIDGLIDEAGGGSADEGADDGEGDEEAPEDTAAPV
jgi:hypothetical protein